MHLFERDQLEFPASGHRFFLGRARMRLAEKIAPLIGKSIDETHLLLERPKKDLYGHVMLPVARLRKDFRPLVEEICSALESDPGLRPHIEKVMAAGPLISIFLRIDKAAIIREIRETNETYGHTQIGRGKRIVIDTSSPNIAKPFHVGHLRSTILGNFLKNIYSACGYEPKTLNYLGDWGKQYGLLAVGYQKYGDEAKLENDPIGHMFDVYVKINEDAEKDPAVHGLAREYFKRMEAGSARELEMWKVFRDKSIVAYNKIYDVLGITFDIWSGEAAYEGKMRPVVEELERKGLLVESKNALCMDLEAEGLGIVMLKKTDGASLYMTRDLAAAEDRVVNMRAEYLVYVVASQQDQHFAQLFEIWRKAGKGYAGKGLHINYGLIKGMKTRKGNVVFLEDVIAEAQQKVLAEMKKNTEKYAQIQDPVHVAQTIAVSAIVVQDMLARRIRDYVFHIDRVVSFEGDTGPYLQYTHSRLASIIRRAALGETAAADLSLLQEKEIEHVIVHLARYPEFLIEAMVGAEPCIVVGYLMRLSRLVSSCFETIWVAGQEEGVARARVAFYETVKSVMYNGMRLIGLSPLERM